MTFCYSLATADQKRQLWAIIPKVADAVATKDLPSMLRESYDTQKLCLCKWIFHRVISSTFCACLVGNTKPLTVKRRQDWQGLAQLRYI